uniref:EF-hand domain-containing protein n=1 Tax=Macrostomum lignano TaxID=282301 RepID=A0A1I8GC60_9PLAT
MGKSSSKLSSKESRFLMEVYSLTDEQLDEVYRDFRARAGKKNYLDFEDFRALYSGSRFEHDVSDQLAVFRALADSERLTLAGYVRLCQLSQSAGSGPDPERLRVLFSVMDEDQSGTISEDEFCRFLANFVDDETTMQNFFARADEVSGQKQADLLPRICQFLPQAPARAFRLMCAYVFPQVR